MRINEILTESQLQQLEEGPKLDALGRGIGGVVSGAAKGIGAVAGGVRGAFTALKKGYQTGKAIVGDDPDPNAGAPGYTAPADKAAPAPVADPKVAPTPDPKVAPVADPKVAPTPAPEPSTTPPSAKDINAQGPEGSAPAKDQTGAAGAALAKTDAVTDKQTTTKAGETVYAQVKANIDKLDKKGKQRILQLLTKSIATPDPKPAATPSAGAGAFGQMAQQLAGGKPPNTMANAPVSATNKADPSNPNLAQPAAAPAAGAVAPAAEPTAAPTAGQGAFANAAQQLAKPAGRAQGGGKVKGELSQDPRAVKRRADRAAAAAAKQPAAVTASLVHHGFSLNEVLAQKLEMHKRRMFESALNNGTASVFVK